MHKNQHGNGKEGFKINLTYNKGGSDGPKQDGTGHRKRLTDLRKGDVFTLLLGDGENGVTYTLLDLRKISGYPGLRLTVRRRDGRAETIYGRPFTTVPTERIPNESIQNHP